MSSSVSFEGAPVSGAVLLASVTSSLIAQGSHQSWSHGRSTSPSLRGSLAFKFAGELALGSLLLYQARVFERHKGTRRHGAVILAVFALDQLVHFALRSVTTLKFQPGPYSLIAFNFAAFYSDIPATSQSRILGLQLSNKVFLYAAHAYFLASAARHSGPSLATGAALGLAYHCNFFNLRALKVPSSIARGFNAIFGRFSQDSQHRARVSGVPQNRGVQTRQDVLPVIVSEESLAQLRAMGFDEDRARAALLSSRNDVQRAIAELL